MKINALFVCCLCLMGSPGLISISSSLKLWPDDPIVEFGKSLELYCNITASDGNVTSSSICFYYHPELYCKHNNINVDDKPKVIIVDSTTAKFTYPNMNFSLGGHYQCRLGSDIFQRSSQSVIVIRKPDVPRNISCVAWNNLTCSWLPSYSDQHNYTTGGAHNAFGLQQTLMWTQGTTNSTMDSVTCSSNSKDGCPCKENPAASCAIVGMPTWPASLCVSVTVSNVIGNAFQTVCYNESNFMKIVKPDRLSMPNISSYNTSTVISLAPPPHTVQPPIENFEFLLTYQSQWMMESSNLITNNSRVELETFPDSKYTAKVTVKPAGFGRWSDETPFEFSIPPTAPSTSPVTDPSAFEIISEGEPRKLTVYWKKLEPQYYFGPNFKYIVVGRSANNESWNELGSVTNQSQLVVNLTREEREVAVLSHNDIGTTLPQVTIIVPTTKSPVLMPNAVHDTEVERNSSLVVYRWTSEASVKFTHFVLFWCQSHAYRYCSSEIDWISVPGDVREHTIQLTNNSTFMYGVAGVSGSLSTGVRWISNHCAYKFTDYPNPPVNVMVSTPSDGDPGELDVIWSQPKCSNAYISLYGIYYCRLVDTQHCADASHVNVTGNVTRHRLQNLEHGVNYSVWLCSVTRNGRSGPTSRNDSAITSELPSWRKPWFIFVVSLGGVCCLVLVIVFIWKCLRGCRTYLRRFTADLEIHVPENEQFLPGDSSGILALGYTQISTIRELHEEHALLLSNGWPRSETGDVTENPQPASVDSGALYLAQSSAERLPGNNNNNDMTGPVVTNNCDNNVTASVTIHHNGVSDDGVMPSPPENHYLTKGGYLLVTPQTFSLIVDGDVGVPAETPDEDVGTAPCHEISNETSCSSDSGNYTGLPGVLQASDGTEPCIILTDSLTGLAEDHAGPNLAESADVSPGDSLRSQTDDDGTDHFTKYAVISFVSEPSAET